MRKIYTSVATGRSFLAISVSREFPVWYFSWSLEPWLPERPGLQLYYPRNSYMTYSLRAFIDYVKATH